jgi:DNA helicase-2/ATP-dependent DNA helicase PcrA
MARRYTLNDSPTASAATGRIDLEGALNDEQRAVATAPDGVMLVLAGAGSGKTRAITYRVAALAQRGVALDNILLVTFTNRAAREMTSRVGELLQTDTRGAWAGTFHSIGRRLLLRHGHALGLRDPFTILDGEDAETLMKQVIAERVVKRPDAPRFPSPGVLTSLLSRAVNTGRGVTDLLVADMPHFAHWEPQVIDCLSAYQSRKSDFGLVDFDDLLLFWHRLMHDVPDAAAAIGARFVHTLVDEYQDTNRLQAEIIDAVARTHGNLCVVGDDFQSIYSFRGADFRNILEFETRHPSATRYLLRRNYRSSPEIVAVANHVIAGNSRQFAKELVAVAPPGPLPALVRCRDETEQNRFVGQRVLELRDEGVPLERIAVLYRAHYQSMELQLELNRRNIPYVVRSGLRFFEQRHIKDVLAFLRVVVNPLDELAMHRLVQLSDGMGPAAARRVFEAVRAHGDVGAALKSGALAAAVPARARPGWATLAGVLERVADARMAADAGAALDVVVNDFYATHAERVFDNAPHRLRELETLAAYAGRQGSMREFLDSLALATDLTGVDTTGGGADEALVLSSVHQAKGLEFRAVFIIGLADELFPLARAATDDDELEEERRLFYVAVTRAERELYCTVPAFGWDRQRMPVVYRPSRFLTEVLGRDPAALEPWELG